MRIIVFTINSPSFAFFHLFLVITMSKRKVNAESTVPVIVSVSFVPAKLGSSPKVKICSPKDISDSIGRITMDMFDELKEELAEYVGDHHNREFFHFDDKHDYLFDGRAWEHGTCIYGRKGRAKDSSEKVTQTKLIPIRNQSEFKEMVRTTATKVYEDIGQRSTWNKKGKQRKLSHFETSLCVVLLKVKASLEMINAKKNKNDQNSTVVSFADGGGKQPPSFKFFCRKLCINLYEPLITSVKKSRGATKLVKATGTQKGKTVREFVYDLEPYISKPSADDDSLSDCSYNDVSNSLFLYIHSDDISLPL